MRTGVEPRDAAAEQLDVQLSPGEVGPVDVRDLELTAGRGLKLTGDVEHPVVIEVQPRQRVARARCGGLLLDGKRAPALVQLHYAVTVGVAHVVREHRRAAGPRGRRAQHLGQAMTEEDVVPEDERDAVAPGELPPDDEGLGEPLGPLLHGVMNR